MGILRFELHDLKANGVLEEARSWRWRLGTILPGSVFGQSSYRVKRARIKQDELIKMNEKAPLESTILRSSVRYITDALEGVLAPLWQGRDQQGSHPGESRLQSPPRGRSGTQ